MTKDLEETLAELGPGYREVVALLKARDVAPVTPAIPRRAYPRYLAAASISAALLAVACLFAPRPRAERNAAKSAYTAAYLRDDASLATILASQRDDGSWANDFLTMQNAAALRCANGATFAVAYKKAARYLKSKGLKPLTKEELELRAAAANSFARL